MKLVRTAIFIALLIQGTVMLGIPARGGFATMRQPDGTTFTAILRGDEFLKIFTTADGHAIIQDEDGYYSYAVYGPDGSKYSTGVHVGDVAPSDILSSSMNIPYDILRANAGARKSAVDMSGKESVIRRIARRNGQMSPGVRSGGTSSNEKHGIVILAAFRDVAFQYSKSDFEALLTQTGYNRNGATGCAKDYFDAQFNGTFNFSFEVSDIVTLSNKRSYYGGNDLQGHDKRAAEMVTEACRLADSIVDFSKFDDDGDGEVDNVFVFFAGGDEAQHAGEDCIWSHAWYIKDGAGISLTLDGVIINRYACSSELATTSAQNDVFTGIGTFCHEYSHTFGLPDFYDTDYEGSGGTATGLWGSTSLMDSGGYNNNGNTPPYYNAIEREMLGISAPEELSAGDFTMTGIGGGGKTYRMGGNTVNEYYLIECRDGQEWDRYIGGTGILVYHIDRSSNSAGYSDTYSKGFTASQRWDYNEVNARPDHQCAYLVEAYSQAAYPNDIDRVFFPDGGTATKYVPEFWDGSYGAYTISNMAYADGQATFTVSSGASANDPAAEIFQDCAIVRWTSVNGYTGTGHISYTSGSETVTLDVEPDADGNYAAFIQGLEPGKEQTAKIYFDDESTATSYTFTTRKYIEGSYPYIFLKSKYTSRNSDGSFISGTRLPLVMYNAPAAVSVSWTLDGQEISRGTDGYYHVEKGGMLVATANYEDGSRDIIAKYITVR